MWEGYWSSHSALGLVLIELHMGVLLNTPSAAFEWQSGLRGRGWEGFTSDKQRAAPNWTAVMSSRVPLICWAVCSPDRGRLRGNEPGWWEDMMRMLRIPHERRADWLWHWGKNQKHLLQELSFMWTHADAAATAGSADITSLVRWHVSCTARLPDTRFNNLHVNIHQQPCYRH